MIDGPVNHSRVLCDVAVMSNVIDLRCSRGAGGNEGTSARRVPRIVREVRVAGIELSSATVLAAETLFSAPISLSYCSPPSAQFLQVGAIWIDFSDTGQTARG